MALNVQPPAQADFYKTNHIYQYPKKTKQVYHNFTPRSAARAPVLNTLFDNKVVWFGLQAFIKDFLIDEWNREFFNLPKKVAVSRCKRRMDTALGEGAVGTEHIAALHDLGYLPLEIRSLPEGSRVDLRVPTMTVHNTIDEFFWLTNYIETVESVELWKPSTVATIAFEYRKLLLSFANMTGAPIDFVNWQGHDFSFRGMSNRYDAMACGAAHLLSFFGTDTIPAIDYLEAYYNANADLELIGGSVPATEHSVMCLGIEDAIAEILAENVGKPEMSLKELRREAEYRVFKRLITEVHPTGVVSIVSDTFEFWNVVTNIVPSLKPEIMARKKNALGLAKVVLRPDSGDPVLILTGYMDEELVCDDSGKPICVDGVYIAKASGKYVTEAERKGAVECLWDSFGGTLTSKGYKMLDEHIGLIYGDSITLERAERILGRLMKKGYASSNVVFGIGSFTYQYITRDSFGWAVKATCGIVESDVRELCKDPATDDGTKKSAKGYLRVEREGFDYVLYDQQTWEDAKRGAMEPVFRDGVLLKETSLAEMRNTLWAEADRFVAQAQELAEAA